jgi:hypothetical protein
VQRANEAGILKGCIELVGLRKRVRVDGDDGIASSCKIIAID